MESDIKKQSRNVCLYHRNCNDGLGAALAVWLKYPEMNPDTDFVAVQYQQDPPWELIYDNNIFIVDFSYPLATIERIAEVAKFVTLIDHHKTAQQDLARLDDLMLPNVICIFDMSRSGAALTWDFLFTDPELPLVFQYIQDRDLWTKELPGCDDVYYGLQALGQDLRTWRSMFEDIPVGALKNNGRAINAWVKLPCTSHHK